jgi:hypothetical protein
LPINQQICNSGDRERLGLIGNTKRIRIPVMHTVEYKKDIIAKPIKIAGLKKREKMGFSYSAYLCSTPNAILTDV